MSTNLAGGYSFHQGYPFSTYGETISIVLQNSLICYLMYAYKRIDALTLGIFLTTIISITLGFYLDLYPEQVYFFNQALVVIFGVQGKLYQVIESFRNGSTGSLSLITTLLAWGGSLARVFTTFQETPDDYILMVILTLLIYLLSERTPSYHKPRFLRMTNRVVLSRYLHFPVYNHLVADLLLLECEDSAGVRAETQERLTIEGWLNCLKALTSGRKR